MTALRWFLRLASDAPALMAITVLQLAAIPVLLAAMALDERTYLGLSIWVKPLKFAVSTAVFSATLAVYARWVPQTARQATWFRAAVWVAIAAMIYENVWISGAAAAGTSSHFNETSPLMSALYTAAGVGAVILILLAAIFGVVIARNRTTGLPPIVHTALWTGLVATFVLTLVTAGYLGGNGGHFVGGDGTDLQGWPIMGWATDGGDLRVPHFFATHAMHIVPGAALLLATAGIAMRVAAWGIVAGYAAFVGYAFAEALSGVPFLGWVV